MSEEDNMHRISLSIWIIAVAFTVFLFALEYIDASGGLETPEMEAGRTEIEVADINGDGNVDILSIGDHGSPYVNTDEHGVMVWFGDGQGVWSVFQNGDFGYGGIAVGDVNNDGLLDIGYGMHHNYSSSDFGDSILEVALGDGTGQNWITWDDGIATGGDWGMFCTDFADIDNDGYLDIGANSFGADDGVHLFVNNGDGTWQQCFGFSGGNSTMDFLFGDINADGCADFVAAHQFGSVYLGDGIGNFALADGNLPPGGNLGRRGPDLGDIDNDGDLDLAFCNNTGGVEVWLWLGSETWFNASGSLPDSGSFQAAQIADMDIDGFNDIAAFGDSTITIWLGDGTGNWTEEVTFTTPGPGDLSAFRVGGDIDHNGYPDIVLVAEEHSDPWTVNRPRCYRETSTTDSLFIFPVFPRGGETFIGGSVHAIEWTCGVPSGMTATITLELSWTGPSGPWSTIATDLPNNGRYQWRVPFGISSDLCHVRYTAITVTDTSVAITPMAFRISPAAARQECESSSAGQGSLIIAPTLSTGEVRIMCHTQSLQQTIVAIYDVNGRCIKQLLDAYGGGSFHLYWDTKDQNGNSVAAGEYFVVMKTGACTSLRKIVVIDSRE